MGNSARSVPRDTRGEILTLLCKQSRTVTQLAHELGMSKNSVRGQLDRLEEEGLVRHQVVRRGVGKPAHEYQLTEAGSLRLSRAYLPLLKALLAAGKQHLAVKEEETHLREAGRVLARQFPKPDGPARKRMDAAVQLLGELGGITMVREEAGVVWIQGGCCPFYALVPEHPLVCKAIEAMLIEFIGVPVREECEKRGRPSCRLLVGALEAQG